MFHNKRNPPDPTTGRQAEWDSPNGVSEKGLDPEASRTANSSRNRDGYPRRTAASPITAHSAVPPAGWVAPFSEKKGDTMIADLVSAKHEGRKLTVLTCYDAYSAAILAETGIDAVLVGDSAAMVVHGRRSTLEADIDMIVAHVRAVRAGGPELTIIADMPFATTRQGTAFATAAAAKLMAAGADAVKIEGRAGHEDLIPHLIGSGIPVQGHLGLMPQSFNVLGGYRVQGRESADANKIADDAAALARLGCFSIVLECVPSALAARISRELSIPVIGIGAGPAVDGQVLVLQDMLGFGRGKRPKFVRTYLDAAGLVAEAVGRYIRDVHSGDFPAPAESYGPVEAAGGAASVYGSAESAPYGADEGESSRGAGEAGK